MENRISPEVVSSRNAGHLALSIALTLCCFTSCAQSNPGIPELDRQMKSGTLTVSDVLTSEKYLSLHSDKEFRALIRKYAPQGKISVVTAGEPGIRVKLSGRFTDRDQKPKGNTLFYFYHTMHNGLYADGGNGQQEIAKLFGYMRTDKDGKFEINTIKPAGYPGERFPSHVHLEIYDDNGKILLGTEFQFEDDPKLDKATRENSIRFGNYVAANSGTSQNPVYYYNVIVP
jgi:protocatechuate 3,4-dioxygenase beta subunit